MIFRRNNFVNTSKFEHKLRRHKQRFGEIATKVVWDKDKNLLWSRLQWHRSCHCNEMTLLPCLRFASLWRTNSHGDSCVLGVHLSNVCLAGLHSVFVERLSFKSLLNLRKAYIFQEFAEGLLSICVCWIFQNVHLSGKSFSGRCATKYNKSTEMWSSAAPFHHDLKYFWHRTNENFRSTYSERLINGPV